MVNANGTSHEDGVVLHYRTGWPQAYVHLSQDGGGSWRRIPFGSARDSPIGPDFRVARLPGGSLRFALTDGGSSWDNPAPACDARYSEPGSAGAHDYVVRAPGVYVLFGGRLSLVGDASARSHAHEDALPTLRRDGLAIVTDIDGTLFGCEDGLSRLYELWCRQLALSGAYLVYNTGRGIDSVVDLVREQRKIMPVPAAAVTRVGGYVHWFRGDGACGGRARGAWSDLDADEPHTADAQWHGVLTGVPGWGVHVIPECRRVATRVIDTLPDGDARWLVDGSGDDACVQIALLVADDSADATLASLRDELAHLPVKFIMSGSHGFKYLDITVGSGGKLGGTKYVAESLPGGAGKVENVVFFGDSGNDIDALQGDVKGVIVGNADKDLMRAHRAGTRKDTPYGVVVAKAGFAGGIVEGLARHGFLA